MQVWFLLLLLILLFLGSLWWLKSFQERSVEVETNEGEDDQIPKAAPARRNIQLVRRRSIAEKAMDFDQFDQIVGDQECYTLDMDVLWQDSTIHKIHFARRFQWSLHDFFVFYRSQSLDGSGIISNEIGGFLMGRYAKTSSGRYHVMIESFVPIKSEMDNPMHLEFSVRSLTIELGAAQDRYPDLVVVGWFHTHPGHGLFLSKPDLQIQRGFFDEKFQFAMEVDTLTPNQDLACFTHRQDGEMNNFEKISQNWFSWIEIEQRLVG